MSKLYVVATPIGNLKDITLRALEVLGDVDLIAAEDTRVTIKLLNHYDIKKPMISYHKHNLKSQGERLIEEINSGKTVALVSDAGLPGISDPGEDLIKSAIEHGIDIEVIPGATASLTALVLSGLSTDKFIFEGFLPTKTNERKRELLRISTNPYSTIIYESPHRLTELLELLSELFGDREISLSREMTKKFEETFRGTPKEALEYFKDGVKGEIVLVISGYEEEHIMPDDDFLKQELSNLLTEGFSRKDAVKQLADKYNMSKNTLYALSLDN